jgi:F-type H+-transporting ATPase subunit a
MEEPTVWVTVIVNRLFGKIAAVFLAYLHIQPADRRYPIPDHVAMEFFVFAVAIAFFLWLKGRISAEHPGATQQCIELLLRNPLNLGVKDMLESSVGHGAEKYMPMLGSVGIFVLFCNLISLVPTLSSPTASKSVPLGCAIVIFLYYNWCGLRAHGVLGYGKHFLGPVIYVSPLMVVVDIFSHLSRLLSLTVRLWVNMLASELLYVTFLALTLDLFFYAGKSNPVGYGTGILALLFPALFIVLHIFVAFVQAFVFTILPVIYLAGAAGEAH